MDITFILRTLRNLIGGYEMEMFRPIYRNGIEAFATPEVQELEAKVLMCAMALSAHNRGEYRTFVKRTVEALQYCGQYTQDIHNALAMWDAMTNA